MGIDDPTSTTINPLMQKSQWENDFYDQLWKNFLRTNLLLVVHVFDVESNKQIASTSMQLNNSDGTIRYGHVELDLFKSPMPDLDNTETAT